jgi:2-O-A-mannosyl-D-glycerate-specific PTS system IIC component
MNLLTLTHADFIFINPEPRTPEALIRYMSDSLARRGVIHDKHAFIDSVLHRESEGPTALGEELAVPHGKSELSPRRPSVLHFLKSPSHGPGWRATKRSEWYSCWPFLPVKRKHPYAAATTLTTSSLMTKRAVTFSRQHPRRGCPR